MNFPSKILSFAAMLAALSPLAVADTVNQISIGGGNTFSSSTIYFADPYFTTGDDGLFAGLNGGTVTFDTTAWNYTTPVGSAPILLYTITGAGADAGESLDFYVSSDSYTLASYTNGVGGTDLSLAIEGDGMFTGNFFSGDMPASFNVTSQGEPSPDGSATAGVSFSGTGDAVAAVTPEPNSLLLLATGTIGATGLFISRRRKTETLA